MRILVSLCLLFSVPFTAFTQSVSQGQLRVCIAGQCESGEMKMEDIENSGGLLIYTSDGDKIGAKSFMISYNIGEREFSCLNEGYMFSDGCKDFIKRMKAGDRFRIDQIKYGDGLVAPMREFKLVD